MALDDRHLQQKEQELAQVMSDFYRFDLSELKKDIKTLVDSETRTIMQDKDSKVQQITQTFKRIAQIKQDHVLDELEVKGGRKVDLEGYQKQSQEHQKLIEDVSKSKTEVRSEITELEIELRRLKEQVSDIKLENKNLEYIIQREEELKRDKEALEEKALLTVTDDLQDQLTELKQSAEQIT
ncbi:hypothetical protein FGO68_gene10404 [Halteria grandinella]|uniref:Uncharacterized protein n=1 Tax=Halteria grandinella TaxID=5974 RepID=A0A8J8T3Q4_HALGN|nr:hypothetical protein FGO68_gene10404 [Halteria grandinella]